MVGEVGDEVRTISQAASWSGPRISDSTCEICQAAFQSKCVHAEFEAQTVRTQAEKAPALLAAHVSDATDNAVILGRPRTQSRRVLKLDPTHVGVLLAACRRHLLCHRTAHAHSAEAPVIPAHDG